jgi:membrane protein implicated in regulation of membrane protease activity
MKRSTYAALLKLFFLVLIIDAVLMLILAGLVLNAFVERLGFTPELITWVAGYISFMIVSSIVLVVLVVLSVRMRIKDAQRSEEAQRRRREMTLKRRAGL